MPQTYHTRLCTVDGTSTRLPGSMCQGVKGPLKIVYRKYQSTSIDTQPHKINLVFLHGNGMNKGIWHYHIHKLYQKYSQTDTPIGTVLAVDWVNQGHSAEANSGKLGLDNSWLDFAKDVQQVVQNEIANFVGNNSINVIVGHSMGGGISMIVDHLEPNLFQSIVVLNPVAFHNDILRQVFQQVFESWAKSDHMKDTFQVEDVSLDSKWAAHEGALPCDKIHPAVLKHYKEKSFYRGFDDRVLRDMLADEMLYPSNKSGAGSIILKSSRAQQLACYFSSFHSVPRMMQLYKTVKKPVYFIHGTDDKIMTFTADYLREELVDCRYHEIEGGSHSIHGENPDIVVDVLDRIIGNIVKENQFVDSRQLESKLIAKYGGDYRVRYPQEMMKEYDNLEHEFDNDSKLKSNL